MPDVDVPKADWPVHKGKVGMFDANMTYNEYNWLPSYFVGWSFARGHSAGLRRYTPHYLTDLLNPFSIFTGLLDIRWQ